MSERFDSTTYQSKPTAATPAEPTPADRADPCEYVWWVLFGGFMCFSAVLAISYALTGVVCFLIAGLGIVTRGDDLWDAASQDSVSRIGLCALAACFAGPFVFSFVALLQVERGTAFSLGLLASFAIVAAVYYKIQSCGSLAQFLVHFAQPDGRRPLADAERWNRRWVSCWVFIGVLSWTLIIGVLAHGVVYNDMRIISEARRSEALKNITKYCEPYVDERVKNCDDDRAGVDPTLFPLPCEVLHRFDENNTGELTRPASQQYVYKRCSEVRPKLFAQLDDATAHLSYARQKLNGSALPHMFGTLMHMFGVYPDAHLKAVSKDEWYKGFDFGISHGLNMIFVAALFIAIGALTNVFDKAPKLAFPLLALFLVYGMTDGQAEQTIPLCSVPAKMGIKLPFCSAFRQCMSVESMRETMEARRESVGLWEEARINSMLDVRYKGALRAAVANLTAVVHQYNNETGVHEMWDIIRAALRTSPYTLHYAEIFSSPYAPKEAETVVNRTGKERVLDAIFYALWGD